MSILDEVFQCPWCQSTIPADGEPTDVCPVCDEIFCPDCKVAMEINYSGYIRPVDAHLDGCWLGKADRFDDIMVTGIWMIVALASFWVLFKIWQNWGFWP